MSKIKVMIADDSLYICEYFALMLNASDFCECIGTASDEASTLAICEEKKPDVILLDVQMDVMNSGLKLIPKLKALLPNLKIIIISVHDEKELVFEAMRLGAYDYIIKNQPSEEIFTSIRNAYEEKEFVRSNIAKLILDEYKEIEKRQESLIYMFNELMCLSKRETEILRLLCDGKKYSEIASINCVEEVTVRTQVSKILKKLKYDDVNVLVETMKHLKVFDLLK